MDLQHIPYTKMESIKKATEDLERKDVVLLEKIHGTNLSVIFNNNGRQIAICKRSTFIGENEKFYNVQKTISLISDNLGQASIDLLQGREGYVRFYGEAYGGNYQNKKGQNCILVQKGMDYSPNNCFAVFDILVQVSNNVNLFLSWDAVKEQCSKFNIPHVPEVGRGKWRDLRNSFDIEGMNSFVPWVLHNLTEVENPQAEGVIVRTTESGWGERYKWKKDKYCETPIENRRKKDNSKNKDLIDTIIGWMNQNRLDAFVSKVGREQIFDMKQMGRNVGGLMTDVMDDVAKDYPSMNQNTKNSMKKPLSRKARILILNYIDEFKNEECDRTIQNVEVDRSQMSNDERIELLKDENQFLTMEIQSLNERLIRTEEREKRLSQNMNM